MFKNEYHQGERQMKNHKKISPKNFQAEAEIEEVEKEIFFEELSEKALNGDIEAMIKLLVKSDRGYEMSEADMVWILQNRQECI